VTYIWAIKGKFVPNMLAQVMEVDEPVGDKYCYAIFDCLVLFLQY